MRSTRIWRFLGALAVCALVVCAPGAAASGALNALVLWGTRVAPALLPFLMVLPALTDEESGAIFARVLRPFARFFGTPENGGAAMALGVLAGSPAGAAATARAIRGASRAKVTRLALLASGASPAYLLGALGADGWGWLLLRSQLAAVATAGLLLRRAFSEDAPSASCPPPAREENPARSAALTLLAIGAYMAFFGALSRALGMVLGARVEPALLMLMELGGGCEAAMALSAPLTMRLPLASAVACFGGVSVFAQCMGFLRPTGVNARAYAVGKLLQAALAFAFTRLQLILAETPRAIVIDVPLATALAATLCLLVAVLGRRWFPHPNAPHGS